MALEPMQPPNHPEQDALPHLGPIESLDRPWWSSFIEEVGALFRPQEKLPPPPQYRAALPGEPTLGPLVLTSLDNSWFHNLRDFSRISAEEKKMPAFQPTSKPVRVKEIWGEYGNLSKALPMSAILHVVMVVLIATVFRAAPTENKLGSVTLIIPVDINPYLAQLSIKPKAKAGDSGGGGGGGQNSPLPPSKGKLPRFDTKQLTPPTPVIRNETPKLAVEPTVIVPQDIQLPQVDIAAFGDPLGKIGLPSAGPGSGGGIGTGRGGGVGSGSGSGVGPGSGGGIGGGAFRVGGGVSAPALLRKVEPEYSEEARKAKYQGTVQLAVEVWPDGRAHNIRVIRSLGLGLDEKAIEAVQKWTFAPGKKDGAPVKVQATIEVNFRLL
jgi:protein TonB